MQITLDGWPTNGAAAPPFTAEDAEKQAATKEKKPRMTRVNAKTTRIKTRCRNSTAQGNSSQIGTNLIVSDAKDAKEQTKGA